MRRLIHLLLLTLSTFISHHLSAQCAAGQTEVRLSLATDDYGYETYWSLVPGGNDCNIMAIASGGNLTQVGCDGGGQQDATTGNGYGNNATVSAGPWCLPTDSSYTLYYVDDYGDGGTKFTVKINGYPVYLFKGAGAGNQFSFTATPPLTYNAELEHIKTYGFNELKATDLHGVLRNVGADTLHNVDVSYAIDGLAPITETLTGLHLAPFTSQHFTLTSTWLPPSVGYYQLKMWVANINGQADMNTSNDTLAKTVYFHAPTPDLIAHYLTDSVMVTTISASSDGLDKPRDLDFAPKEAPELWVVNKKTETTGGSTVTYFNAGLPDQDAELKKDENSWHFMSLPTGIAFSHNGNFATSPGVFDSNHQGNTASHFTGPALWSGDWSIYAEPSGGNGSHIDMIHQSPYCMGIEWEEDNVFWVYDGYNKNIARYDFQEDHGPGNDDHSDGIVQRYTEVQVKRQDDNIVNHLALDRTSGWLYIVDNGNKRVLRMDTKSGEIANALVPYAEPLQEYDEMAGVTWSVYIDSLSKPAGIDIIGNYLLVSDYGTGQIIVYDRTGNEGVELGRIQTGQPGIMGIKIGPDGKIWYVNTALNKVNRLDYSPYLVAAKEPATDMAFSVYPNPSTGSFTVSAGTDGLTRTLQVMVTNTLGQEVGAGLLSGLTPFELSELTPGVYWVRVSDGKNLRTERVIVAAQ